jgi:uncharacterized protein DUF3574
MTCRSTVLIAALAVIVAGCTPAAMPQSCAGVGGAPMLEYQLFFGRGIPGRSDLTNQEWAEFAEQVVTPHLPDGFTAFDADGQWMNPTTHRIAKERSKVILVALPETPAGTAAIAAIKEAYRMKFHQQSVGTTVHPTCGAF